MRAYEFLTEARNYMELFQGMIDKWPDEWRRPGMTEEVKKYIKRAKANLQRSDRIIWALQHLKYYILESHILSREEDDEEVTPWVRKQFNQLRTKFGYKKSTDLFTRTFEIATVFEHLEHFMSLDAPGINDYTFDNQPVTQVLNDFKNIEEQWVNDKEGKGVKILPGDELIVEHDSEQGWWLLARGACSAEGDSMGHCGNKPTEKDGDRILSFRSKVKDDLWKPHLTFILDSNGYLGEMKGRGNDKPAKKYWPAIIKLLNHPTVKGIKGGGYLPAHNFDITELPINQIIKLYNEKPKLFSYLDSNDMFDMFLKHNATNILSKFIQQRPSIVLSISTQQTSRTGFLKLLKYAVSIDGTILNPSSNMAINHLWISKLIKENDIPRSIWKTAVTNGLNPKHAPKSFSPKTKEKEKWAVERDAWQQLHNTYPDSITKDTVPMHLRDLIKYQTDS